MKYIRDKLNLNKGKNKMSKVSILIIHLNGEEVIKNCLDSVYKNSPKNINVLLLLNNASDNSELIVRTKFKNVKIFKTDKRIGFAEGSNFLAKKANSGYIVFLNNDTVVEKGWIDELIKTKEAHPECVACQPKIKSYYKRKKFEYAGAAGGFIDKYGYPYCRGRIFNFVEEDRGQYNDERRIFWGCGVCLLIDKYFFMQLGQFDEDFFMYSEEVDLCWRINLQKKEVWYCPRSVVYHIGSYSTKIEQKKFTNIRDDYLITRNHLLILLKNYSFLNILRYYPPRILLDILASIRFFPEKTVSFLKTQLILPWFFIAKMKKKRRRIQKNRKIKDRELTGLITMKSIVNSYFLLGKKKFNEL